MKPVDNLITIYNYHKKNIVNIVMGKILKFNIKSIDYKESS